jgi:hypothetical protein
MKAGNYGGYTDDFLSKALSCYWDIEPDHMPPELIRTAHQLGEKAPFETPCILKADLDMGIDMFAPGRWYKLCPWVTRDDFFTEKGNLNKLVNRLSFRQQAVVRYHLLGQEDERENAMHARHMMLRLLNRGKP